MKSERTAAKPANIQTKLYYQMFEVTENVIYFYVPQENANDFAAWLNTLPLAKILAAYHRTVSVRIL